MACIGSLRVNDNTSNVQKPNLKNTDRYCHPVVSFDTSMLFTRLVGNTDFTQGGSEGQEYPVRLWMSSTRQGLLNS